jgi:geranylgeranylglycerol-phosphate geranylgeranyltransferase
MRKKLIAYIQLIKPLNNSKSTLYYGSCSFMGSLLAASWKIPLAASLATTTAITLSAFAVYALNDIYDTKIDAVNAPERPLPSGKITITEAKTITVALFAASLLVAVSVSLIAVIFTLLFSTLGITYSIPQIRLKDGYLANVCWGLGIATAILGGASVTTINTNAIAAAFALAFLTAGCGLTKDLKDIEGDKALNMHTMPILLGEKRAIKVMTIMSIIGFPLFFLNMLLSKINIAYIATVTLTISFFAYSLAVLFRNPGSKTIYKKAYKIQAIAGFLIIIAFMLCALT